MIFHISEKDIRYGIGGNCGLCPAALALVERLSVEGHVVQSMSVSYWWVTAYNSAGEVILEARSSVALKSFIDNFDAGKPVQPCYIYLEV